MKNAHQETKLKPYYDLSIPFFMLLPETPSDPYTSDIYSVQLLYT